MKYDKFCPIMQNCHGEDCAWYDFENNRCSVQSLAKELSRIADGAEETLCSGLPVRT